MKSSISRQLVLWLAVPLMLLALAGALVHYLNSVAPSVLSSDRRLREATRSLMTHFQIKNGVASLEAHSDLGPPLPVIEAVPYAMRDLQGRLLIGDARLPVVGISNDTAQIFALAQIDQHSFRSLSTRFDTRIGIVIITVADRYRADEPGARYGFMTTLLWDFVQLDATLILVWLGTHLGLRPVRKLREEIAERSPLDLRAIETISVPREIAPVVVTLNRLFQTIRAAAQSQQQFIANTAHQLRTPITGIQAQLDLLIAEPAAAPIKHRLATLQEGIRQLAHSANQLLTLARADPAVTIAAKNQPLDLGTIVGEVTARFFDRALQLNIDLGAEKHSVSILADPSLIDDLLSNLVDNALKYTPAEGTVTVSAGTIGGHPYLAVEDSGPGIPEGDRQRVKQRFYRLPNSRGHGSGLGLAIVDEIARLYSANLLIGSGAGGVGTRVTVQFPVPT